MAQLHKGKYVRARDDPFFHGMRRGEAEVISKGIGIDILTNVRRNDITRSASDVGRQKKINVELSENDAYYDRHFPNSVPNSIHEPHDRSFSMRSSAASKRNFSPLGSPRSGLKVYLHDIDESTVHSNQRSSKANEEYYSPSGLVLPAYEIPYSVTKSGASISNIPLPPSAALFYCGTSPHMEVVKICHGIQRLNNFLKARRDDVTAGIPSRFLHAVIGPDCQDVGSVASTIMYAFYLNETLNDDHLCIVPVINMTRSDIHSHDELRWLLDSCFVDQSSLIFIDEIDLSYYDLYGSLKLVLVNHSKLPAKQEALKDAVVEIFNCREEASCCTLIADKLALISPEVLVGRGFSRLLLAGILVDTGNLTNSRTTTKDKYMTTLLINGAGRFGCNGLYRILTYQMYDGADPRAEVLQNNSANLSELDAADPVEGEVLRKDFKYFSNEDAADTRAKLLVEDSINSSKSDATDSRADALGEDNINSSKSDAADSRAEVLVEDNINSSKSDAADSRAEILGEDNINSSKSDAADSRAWEVLRKDIKKWSKSGKPNGAGSQMRTSCIGMTSVGISIRELLSHRSTSAENIRSFQQLEKLHLFLIVSGYYDAEKSFKREILVSAESAELMKSLLHFIRSYANVVPLKALRQSGLAGEMRVFDIEKIVSRKSIEKLLEEFNEIAKY